MSARENVGFGDVASVSDMQRVRQAAVTAGVDQTLESLPQGYETVLSRWLAEVDGGVDLSGGGVAEDRSRTHVHALCRLAYT